ncbi:hypothetical protein N7537_000110 [Penicillium hordei]|uniref:Actin-like ATPase domain-containing protein n=1 Tax=Penicillium hordei TaxID=40994 RepID=A0AAD6ED77_9EURO|nr:uncharacterized protein N7537_000110 [Penicillium hordei]KAJ5614996.1 hypothetical protein N7537_000110 [Penicillium hordei]
MTCDRDIIVGIDFGTTASGIALFIPPYGRAGNVFNDVETFQSWEGSFTRNDLVKAPSVLTYSRESSSLPIPPWGGPILAQHMESISWFKLLLDGELDTKNLIHEAQGWANSRGILHIPEGMTALQVIADFLTCLHRVLWQRLGVLVNASGGKLDTTTIQFWFTVPASWSDTTRALMREAISNASFGTRHGDQVHLLTEPQAAMTFALAAVSSFTTGDGVIICDCGGGTVDLASYYISHDNPLIFDELAHSNGELCGSTLIDREFYRLMCERFGDAFESLPSGHINLSSAFMGSFERIKCRFGQSNETIHHLRLEMSPQNPLDARCDDLRMLFHPALAGIVQAIQRQIEEANGSAREIVVNKIVLVGGFSLSPYVYENIRKIFGSDFVIHRPDDGIMAVAQGAVLWGSGACRPRTRVVRCHYGFQGPILTDQSLKNEAALFAAGERYNANYVHEQSGVLLHRQGETAIKTIIICCSERDPPPTSVNDTGTASIGRLICDISRVHLPNCLHFEVDCQLHYFVEYQIRVQLGECGGLLRFEVTCQGKALGKGEVRVDYFRKAVKN